MADDDTTLEKKDAIERRVYNLPANLLARLRAYQVAQSIGSEAEAARRLLDYALQMRDTAFNILDTLGARFAEEKDLRVLAGEILTKHTLVTMVMFDEDSVMFTLRNRSRGRMKLDGSLYSQDADDNDSYWAVYPKPKPRTSIASPSWDTTRAGAGDLDDDIPF